MTRRMKSHNLRLLLRFASESFEALALPFEASDHAQPFKKSFCDYSMVRPKYAPSSIRKAPHQQNGEAFGPPRVPYARQCVNRGLSRWLSMLPRTVEGGR